MEKQPHVLFQLQPVFRLLRWQKRNLSLDDLIRAQGKLASDEKVESEVSGSSY